MLILNDNPTVQLREICQSILPWVWKHRADILLGRHAPKDTQAGGNRRGS